MIGTNQKFKHLYVKRDCIFFMELYKELNENKSF